jgi:hypothetical protein
VYISAACSEGMEILSGELVTKYGTVCSAKRYNEVGQWEFSESGSYNYHYVLEEGSESEEG